MRPPVSTTSYVGSAGRGGRLVHAENAASVRDRSVRTSFRIDMLALEVGGGADSARRDRHATVRADVALARGPLPAAATAAATQTATRRHGLHRVGKLGPLLGCQRALKLRDGLLGEL